MRRLIRTRRLPLEPLNALMRARRLGFLAERDAAGRVVAYVDPILLAGLRRTLGRGRPERSGIPRPPSSLTGVTNATLGCGGSSLEGRLRAQTTTIGPVER